MTLGWRLAKQAGINQGVISTLLGFAGIFNMISFYFGFKEKTNASQAVGVLIMLGCIVCIGFESGKEKEDLVIEEKDDTGINGVLAGIIAILCGLGAAVMMSTRQFFIRKYAGGYVTFDLAIDYCIGTLVLFCIPAIILAYQEKQARAMGFDPDFEWTGKNFFLGTLSGVILYFGLVSIGLAVSVGPGGPCQAMASTHCIWQTMLSSLFD